MVFVMALMFGGIVSDSFAAAKFVSGLVPDWNQPYRYVSPNGPGPDPNRPNPPNIFAPSDQWNAWCAPCSAANLAGHWTDVRGKLVADTNAFPATSVVWGVGPSWKDYLADSNRPPAQVAAAALPTNTTDIGWYMDTNLGVPWDNNLGVMGGYFFAGDAPHPGTFLKNIHVGLQLFLNNRYSLSGATYWQTGTRGVGYFAGVSPSGAPNVALHTETSAFAEIKAEIDTNRTVILCFRHWSLINLGVGTPASGTNSESAFGYTNYVFGTSSPGMPNFEDEYWTLDDNGSSLGHAVACVGYIVAGDLADPYRLTTPTDWVIVHDNWTLTPRNVAVPLGTPAPLPNGTVNAAWVSDTTAVPWPTAAKFVKGLVPDWNQPYQYTAQSPNGGPGPDPRAHFHDQWNAWCVPTSCANLAGHWTDYHGAPVADSTAFAGSTVVWTAGPSWQDYLADGCAPLAVPSRPPPQLVPGPLPATPTDIGWYLDTNYQVSYDDGSGNVMGGYFFPYPPNPRNPFHYGTYVKDIHAGLANFLDSLYSGVVTNNTSGCWDTGTSGKSIAVGLSPTGGAAQFHTNEVSAFDDVKFEINRNHTLIVSFNHWIVWATANADVMFDVANPEGALGASYYIWPTTPPYPGNPNDEDEDWNFEYGGDNLGHAVTAVGYIPANDVLDAGASLGIGPTDWVIVHDNWASTPRNVMIPYGSPMPPPGGTFNPNWVANTIAYPNSGFLRVTGMSLAGATNAVVKFTGIPGGLHSLEWKSDMTNSTWTTCVSNMTFGAGTMQMTNVVSSSEEKRFYRVKASY